MAANHGNLFTCGHSATMADSAQARGAARGEQVATSRMAGDRTAFHKVSSRRIAFAHWRHHATQTACRLGYMLAMYTGLRAISNRVSSRRYAVSAIRQFDRRVCDCADQSGNDSLLLRIHARRPPDALPADTRAGMISVAVQQAGSCWQRCVQQLLRMTSHFGCGDIEMAFYERQTGIVIYGVRNMTAGNSARWRQQTSLTAVADHHREIAIVVQSVVGLLEEQGIHCTFASPDQCVELSVDDRLLQAERRNRARSALRRRYHRLWKRLGITAEVQA